MTNGQQRLSELYHKYLSKNITEEQRLEFLTYVQNPAYAEYLQEMISESYEHPEVINSLNLEARDRIFQSVVASPTTETPKVFRLWPRIAIAAAVAVVLFGAGLFYYNFNTNQRSSNPLVYKNDVAPGTFGATLTLSNGKKIRLSDAENGEVAKETGVMITKSADGNWFTLWELLIQVIPPLPE